MKRVNRILAMVLTVLMGIGASSGALALTVYADSFRFPSSIRDAAKESPAPEETPAPTETPSPDVQGGEESDFAAHDAVVNGAAQDDMEGYINVYGAPDASAEVIAQLMDTSIVRVIGTEGEWVQIEVNGLTGFIEARFVDTPTLEEEVAPRSLYIWLEKPESVQLGATLTLHCVMSGYENLDHLLQWQCATLDADGNQTGEWTDVAQGNDLDYSFTLTADKVNTSWRMTVYYNS